jgi:hypothetical protein
MALLVEEVHRAFVEHPDFGKDDFMTKLKGQMKVASPSAQQLMAEGIAAVSFEHESQDKESCTFISYESVETIRSLEYLTYTKAQVSPFSGRPFTI